MGNFVITSIPTKPGFERKLADRLTRAILSADFISDLSHTEWLGPLLDRELIEQDERRSRYAAAPSGGGRGGRLPGHPPLRSIARTCNVRYSTISHVQLPIIISSRPWIFT
jgi:hypothetical protein